MQKLHDIGRIKFSFSYISSLHLFDVPVVIKRKVAYKGEIWKRGPHIHFKHSSFINGAHPNLEKHISCTCLPILQCIEHFCSRKAKERHKTFGDHMLVSFTIESQPT